MTRLRRRAQFRRVYQLGLKSSGAHVVVFGLLQGEGCRRLGVTATRRIGCAVVRNRARRRIRELFRRHGAAWNGISLDVVVNARDGCAQVPWGDLEADYLRCVAQLKRRLGRLES